MKAQRRVLVVQLSDDVAGFLSRQIASSLPNTLLPNMPPKKKVEEAAAASRPENPGI